MSCGGSVSEVDGGLVVGEELCECLCSLGHAELLGGSRSDLGQAYRRLRCACCVS